MTTDLDRQLFLAKQLPEELYLLDEDGPNVFWKDTNKIVTPREWLHVVSLVEAKLTDNQHTVFRNYLEQHFPYGRTGRAVSASWQVRTDALMEVMK